MFLNNELKFFHGTSQAYHGAVELEELCRTFDVQRLTLGVRRSALNVQRSVFFVSTNKSA
jgi:hypothetical protein